jgi:hypothetical protein
MNSTRIKQLIADGYYSTSNKYRHVTRLPPGKTGMQALSEADPSWVERFEQMAKRHYLRVHADEHRLELTPEEFAEFKRQGGEVA